MSINIDSNKILKFGKTLPTPYIDKVEIYDDRILIQASIYFQKPVTLDEAALERYRNKIIKDINVCAFIFPRVDNVPNTLTYNLYSSLVHNEELNIATALSSGRATPLDLLYMQYAQGCGTTAPGFPGFPRATDPIEGTPLPVSLYEYSAQPSGDGATLLKVFSDAEDDITTHTIYDTLGNPVERVIYTTEFWMPQDETYPNFIEGMTPALLETKYEISGRDAYKALDLVLFSTSLDIEDYRDRQTYRDYDINLFPDNSNKAVLERAFSDITYEQIGEGGVLKAANSIVYRTPAGTVYEGEAPPIQSIDFLYYGSIAMTQAEMVEKFRSIMGTSTDGTVQEAYDNVNYILEMYGTSTNLLVKLNEYRKIFPETSTAVPAGRFYENFERLLYNTNNAVKRGIVLAKQLNLNPIIKDYRTMPSFTLDPSTDPDNKEPYTNTKEYIYLQAGPGKSTMYSAYADPSSIDYEMSDFDPELLKDYPDFADVETYTQAAKKLRARFENVEDLRWNIQSFLTDRILDKYETKIRSYDSTGTDLLEGQIDLGYTILDGSDGYETYTGFDVFMKNAADHVSVERLLIRYYNQIGGDRAILEAGMGEAGENLGTLVDTDADAALHDNPTLAGTFTNLIDTSSDVASKIKTAFVIDATDPVVEYFNSFQSEYSGVATFTTGNDEITDQAIEYRLNQAAAESLDDYFRSEGFNIYDETVILSPEDIVTLKDLWNEYQVEANYVHFISEILDGLTISAPSVDGANHYLFGYWFFDYEKALRNNSVISHAFSITKLEQIFGREFVQDKYAIKECTIDRYVLSDIGQFAFAMSGGPPDNYEARPPFATEEGNNYYYKAGTIITHMSASGDRCTAESDVVPMSYIGDLEGISPVPLGMQSYVEQPDIVLPWWAQTGFEMHGEGQRMNDIAKNSTTEYTYNILRSFNTPGDKVSGGPFSENSNETLSGYRLACFEHQEVVEAQYSTIDGQFVSDFGGMTDTAGGGRSFLQYTVTVEDKTILTYGSLIKNYKETLESTFDDYFMAALDQCNYDNVDQTFNKFFVDSINQTYGANIALAPWFRMPVLYQLHADLLFDIHQGDMELILAAARSDTENIAPETGTVEELIAFRNKALSLWDNYYAMGGQIHDRIAAYMGYDDAATESMNNQIMNDGQDLTTKTITYGGSECTPATMYDFPPIVNLMNVIKVTTQEDTDTDPRPAGFDGDADKPFLGMTEGFIEGDFGRVERNEKEPEDSRESGPDDPLLE